MSSLEEDVVDLKPKLQATREEMQNLLTNRDSLLKLHDEQKSDILAQQNRVSQLEEKEASLRREHSESLNPLKLEYEGKH